MLRNKFRNSITVLPLGVSILTWCSLGWQMVFWLFFFSVGSIGWGLGMPHSSVSTGSSVLLAFVTTAWKTVSTSDYAQREIMGTTKQEGCCGHWQYHPTRKCATSSLLTIFIHCLLSSQRTWGHPGPKITFCHEIPKCIQLCQFCYCRTTTNVLKSILSVICVREQGLDEQSRTGSWSDPGFLWLMRKIWINENRSCDVTL